MSDTDTRTVRGRPKALERDHIVRSALMRYWADGPRNVSINDVSLATGASKPGIYREFGSDDGLKEAVLSAYSDLVLQPLFGILVSDQTFNQALDALIEFTVQDRGALGLPDGCLHVVMRSQRDEFGPLTQQKIDELRGDILARYRDWIDRAKKTGQLETDMPTNTAALYFDTHNGSAMRLQKEGVGNATIETILRTAFSVFR